VPPAAQVALDHRESSVSKALLEILARRATLAVLDHREQKVSEAPLERLDTLVVVASRDCKVQSETEDRRAWSEQLDNQVTLQ